MPRIFSLFIVLVLITHAAASDVIDASTLKGKLLCGYQGWFRAQGDGSDSGWHHWGRGKELTPDSVSFEMWPDGSELTEGERFATPNFTDAEGKPMWLYSADHPRTVERHFEWMRTYGMDGVWLQHFLVDLLGGPSERLYASRSRVLNYVREAATKTGRVWAITFDISGMPTEKIVDVLTREWKKLVDQGITQDPRYVHEGGKPVVEIWGFYPQKDDRFLTAQVANQLIDLMKTPGPYAAYLVGGGAWNWRKNTDPEWQAMLRRLDAYSPWNTGNLSKEQDGTVRAGMGYWADDKRECEQRGQLWLPVIYPGFSWDNLQHKPAGSTNVPRRKGQFLWEQFHALSKLGVDSACVAMFDEVDEGTAIFKVTNQPPIQGHFVTYEDMPSDWYLRLVGKGTRLLREKLPVPMNIPISPTP